jgi:HEAT repeat protein
MHWPAVAWKAEEKQYVNLGEGTLLISLVFSIGAAAQQHSPVLTLDHGQPMTVEEQLQHHHIALTIPALVKALQNADPEVRELAAGKLADLKAAETIPKLRHALGEEAELHVRLNIAYALARLGDSMGIHTLEQSCRDVDLDYWRRIQAAEYMVQMNHPDEGCRKSLIELLQSHVDSNTDADVLEFLPNYKGLTREETQKTIELVKVFLSDSDLRVRLVASHSLAEMGDKSVIPYLEKATKKDINQMIRPSIESDIKWLQRKEAEKAAAP